MYYEDKGFRIEITKFIQSKVDTFFSSEMKADSSNEQLLTLSAFNLNQFCYVQLTEDYYLDDFKIAMNVNLKHLFSPANPHDLLTVRLDQLLTRAIVEFGKELLDELRDDLIQFILDTRMDKRYSPEFTVEKVTVRKRWFEYLTFSDYRNKRREKKKHARLRRDYRNIICDLFFMYPVLVLVPFLNAAVVKHGTNVTSSSTDISLV